MGLISTKRRLGLAAAGLVLLIVIIALVIFVPRALGYGQPPPPPKQPIAFSHITHVKVAGAQCIFCHRTVETGAAASIPSVEQCMFCHRVIGKDNPEVQKLRDAYESKRPIDWVRVHRVPDSVHFFHQPHIRVGVTCADCHGDVGSMAQVRQVRVLRMGACLACHRASNLVPDQAALPLEERRTNAPTECSFCHY